MAVKLGALIVRPGVDRPRRKQQESDLIPTLRFFEGLGKALSTWEIEMLARAEKEYQP